MSKYLPLQLHLARQPGARVEMSFAEIEAVLGFPLPASAHAHQAWWANEAGGRHAHAHAWMEAGWRVERADRAGGSAVFICRRA